MTLAKIEEAKKRLESKRTAVLSAERDLQRVTSAFLTMRPEGVRSLARKLDLSAAYVSDIIRGRRGLSDSVFEKLKELK